MKGLAKILVLFLSAGFLAACYPASYRQDDFSRRKIYLTEEDYLEDLDKAAAAERREAKPLVESEYIFNATPDTDRGVYFFDERQQPKVPGQPSAADYKREKRLWKRPKRYSPEQYYGMQSEGSSESSSGEISYDY